VGFCISLLGAIDVRERERERESLSVTQREKMAESLPSRCLLQEIPSHFHVTKEKKKDNYA
jgi:hypothetical protein